MVVIIDNAFDEGFGEAFLDCCYRDGVTPSPKNFKWYPKDKDSLLYPFICKIINIVKDHFNLKNMVGTEIWLNDFNIAPFKHKHIDTDEKAVDDCNFNFTPICSIVYYPTECNPLSGKLLLNSLIIPPLKNRLVIFSNNIIHEVTQGIGNRISIAINPFDYTPKNYV